MSNTIKIKKSNSAGATPNTLEHGELAINYEDGKLYYKDAANAIKNIVETKAIFSENPPSNPVAGNFWYRTTNGRIYTYYDETWVELGSGGIGVGVSEGGSTGQVLVKDSGTDYDTSWASAWQDANFVIASQVFG